MTKKLNRALALVLTIAALMTGQRVWADEPSNIELSTSISGGSLELYSNEACTTAFDAAVAAGATVYVKAMPAPGYTALGVAITAVDNSSNVVAVTAVSNTLDVYRFTMPANGNSVTVSATFAMPAQQQVSYVDESYTTHENVDAYVLDETMSVLPVGFYVVPNGLTIDHRIDGNGGPGSGSVTIIIPDGKTLTVNGSFGMGCSLSFFGQANATGKLTINNTGSGVNIGGRLTVANVDVTSNGGSLGGFNGCIFAGHQTNGNTVTVSSNSSYAISSSNGVTIKYCNVDLVSESGSGILPGSSDLTVTGLADGSNTLKLRSKNNAISGGNNITIKYCDVDIINESNSAITCGNGDVTIEGVATGDKVNTVIVRSDGSGISTGGGITMSYCDVEMTGTTKTGDVYDLCPGSTISCSGGVTITGRADGNNTVKVRCGGNTNSSGFGIDGGGGSVTISHCDVDVVSGCGPGINTGSNVTITGGQVDITGGTGKYGIYSGNGIITLGWINAIDYIRASSYYVLGNMAMKTATGQRFVAYNAATGTAATAIVSGASNDSNPTFTLDGIAGKTLKPLIGHYISIPEGVSLTGKTADFTIGTTSYYICNADEVVTLNYDNLPDGYIVIYSYDDGTGDRELSGNTFTMPANDVTVSASIFPTFSLLQEQLTAASSDANNPTVITLDKDYVAASTNTYLELEGGRKVILDLNGHTIDRHLTEAKTNTISTSSLGCVIRVYGSNTSLTIRDSSTGQTGTITGGWSSTGAGCINVTNGATLRIEGGTITGNRVQGQGGTIYFSGNFYMTGGTITGNAANLVNNNNIRTGGAIYFGSNGDFYMTGGSITGNYCGTTGYGAAGIGCFYGSYTFNVHLSGTYDISGNQQGTYDAEHGTWNNLSPSDVLNNYRMTYVIDGAISPSQPASMVFDITPNGGSKATITSGWSTYMDGEDPEDYFILANPNGQGIGVVGGEATIGTLHTITLGDGITANATQAAAGRPITLSGGAPSVSRYVVTYNDGEAHTDRYMADANGQATFQMPAADVSVSSETAVAYIDADGSMKYCTDFTVVNSNYEFGTFGSGSSAYATLGVNDKTVRWYAIVGTVNVNSWLKVNGNARLILCDGAALNVNSDYYGSASFSGSTYGLTIYGQALGTGTLSVTNTGCAISVEKDITVNGGTVIATTTGAYGINISGTSATLTINRGTVTATGNYGIHIYSGTLTQNGGTISATGSGTNGAGINATDGARVNILGGTFNATCTNGAYGIRAFDNGTAITLGWTTPTDRITATSIHLDPTYGTPTLKVKAGQTLTDGNGAAYSGTLTDEQIDAIGGKTLQPATSVVFAKEGYGTAYYGDYDLVLPAGMKAKIVTENNGGKLTYQTIANGDDTNNNVVPKATAVMLQVAATDANQTLGVAIAAPETNAISGTNYLHGSDTQTTTTGEGKHYKLSYDTDGKNIGWYWGANEGAAFTSAAHKAWLVLPPTVNANMFMGLPDFEEEATGIMATAYTDYTDRDSSDSYNSCSEINAWHTLDGRKLNDKPTKKGLYIHRGKKVVLH